VVALTKQSSKRGPPNRWLPATHLKKLFGYGVELDYIDINPMNDVFRRFAG